MSYGTRRKTDPLADASELLFVVESEWPKVGASNFNPLDTVLPLLDSTSVGLAHRYSNFVQLKEQIADTLGNCIDSNRQQFIDHLSYYNEVSKTFKESFELVEQISTDLSQTNDSIIADNKTYLKDLNHNSIVYGQLLDTMDAIAYVKTATEQLSGSIADKNFVGAHEQVLESFRLADQFHLWRLPALQSVKSQLEDQAANLFEMVVEEVHGIVYMKLNVNKISVAADGGAGDRLLDITRRCAYINRQFAEFVAQWGDQDDDQAQQLSLSALMVDDDRYFNKLKNLLIVLHRLGKLDKALEILVRRQSTELHAVYAKTVEDIKLRNPTVGTQSFWQDAELATFEFGPTPQEVSRLRDLFTSISDTSLYVLQYHRVIYEVASKLGHDYAIEKVLEFMETQLLSIVSQYTVDEDISFSKNKGTVTAFSKKKAAKLFELKAVENDQMARLTSQLQEFFPTFNLDDKVYLDNNELNTNLDTIVMPGVFNMRIVLGPLLVFVEGCKALVPMSKKQAKTTDRVFVEFMRNEYLKNFNQTLEYHYDALCNPNESFDMLINNNGIYKSCENFQRYLYSILEILNTSLVFKEEYANSIFIILNSLAVRFQSYYQEISDEEDFNWLHDKQLTQVSLKVMHAPDGGDDDTAPIAQELEMIFKNLGVGNELVNVEIFLEKSSQLLNSVQWLLTWLPDLLRVHDLSEPAAGAGTGVDKLKKNWELVDVNFNHTQNKKLYLTLDAKNGKRFEGFIAGLQSLKDNISLILRYNLIYQSTYSVLKFFHTNEFYLLNEINEPDANILKLTSVFLSSSKIFSRNLQQKQDMHALFKGLSAFLDQLFITGSFKIKRLNENGLKKIFLNILILQQLLRNLFQFEIKFLKSLQYFENFKINDKGLLDQIGKKNNSFSYEENKNMIRLIYSEDMKNAKRYNDSIAKLAQLYSKPV